MKSFTVLLVFGVTFVAYGNAVDPVRKVLLSGSREYHLMDSDTGKPVKVYYHKPRGFDGNTPVVIIIHGRLRNAATYRDQWQKLAEEHNLMILVPFFGKTTYPGGNGFNLGNVFTKMFKKKVLGELIRWKYRIPIAKWSFNLPDRVFADFKERETSQQSGYTLYGHGGGGQFATRFALMAPVNHACRVIAANPGWYTYPTKSVNWPFGLGDVNWVSDTQIDHFLRIPMLLMLGDNDRKTNGVMRQTNGARTQGRNRKMRGKRFFNYAQKLAEKNKVTFAWKLLHVPDVGHSDAQMSSAAAGHIFSCI